MSTVLGLFGMAIWLASVIALAAGITYAVVKLTPERAEKPQAPDTEA
jgi:hypothetical protein